MAKRVLGDDPFSSGEDAAGESSAGKKASRAPAGKASRAPAKGTPSRAPAKGARTSKAPSAKGRSPATEGEESLSVQVPKSAAVPREAEAVMAAADEAAVLESRTIDAADARRDDDARTGVDEAAAQADVPPRLVSEPPPAPAIASVESAPLVEPDAPELPLEQQIADVEAQLDRLLQSVGERGGDREKLERVAERLRERVEAETARISLPPGEAGEGAGAAYDVARELLSSEFGARQWGRVAMRDRAEQVDDFGYDEEHARRWRPFFDFLFERWWRVEVHDIDRVPAEGRAVLCANHSGALPYDGAMLATALRREHPTHRELRWLAEDFVFHMPFLGVFMNRIGAVRACQENAERLLDKDACVGVFPEGVKGISKLYRDRYKLQRFGRGGHVKLAMRTRAPLVPVAILGAEEAHPLIAPTGLLAKSLGVPFVPITPTFPLLGPLGLVPLPSRWKMYFLEPIPMDNYGPEAAEDDVLVGRLNEKIRGLIQDQLDRAVRDRRGVFSG